MALDAGGKLAKDAAQLGSDTFPSAMKRVRQAATLAGQDNYVSKSAPSLVQPITLIDARCTNIPFTDDVLATALNTIIGYYLLSVSMDDSIAGVSISKRLEGLNPDRSIINASRDLMAAMESSRNKRKDSSDDDGKQKIIKNDGAQGFDGNTNKIVSEVGSMGVGKIVDVRLQADNVTYTVPVSFMLRPMAIRPDTLAEMIDVSSYDGSVSSRWLKVRTGEIRFLKDFIFAADRMDAYFKTASKDKSGFFEETQKRSAKGLTAAALSGTYSTGTNSNILLISSATIKDFERNTMRSFDDVRVRNEFFANTNAILVMILDAEWETVTIYTRGISTPGTYSAKSLKNASKKGGDDIMSILKAYEAGKAPGRY